MMSCCGDGVCAVTGLASALPKELRSSGHVLGLFNAKAAITQTPSPHSKTWRLSIALAHFSGVQPSHSGLICSSSLSPALKLKRRAIIILSLRDLSPSIFGRPLAWALPLAPKIAAAIALELS